MGNCELNEMQGNFIPDYFLCQERSKYVMNECGAYLLVVSEKNRIQIGAFTVVLGPISPFLPLATALLTSSSMA